MTRLLQCNSCARHVDVDEATCPFCAAALDFSGAPTPVAVEGRFSRAGILALAATLSGPFFMQCGHTSQTSDYGAPSPPVDAADSDASDGGSDGSD